MNKIKRFIIQSIFGFCLLVVYIKAKLLGEFKPSGFASSFQGTEKLNENFFIVQGLLTIDRIGKENGSVLVE